MSSTGDRPAARRLLVALPTLLAAALSSAEGAGGANPARAEVHMRDIAFIPQTISVVAGTTVTWTNDDDMTHTVTSGSDHDEGAWRSSSGIPPGGTFRVTLVKPGTYKYYCKPHMYSPMMHAIIVVNGNR